MIGRQRARQSHALLHAARKLVGIAGTPAGQAHLLQCLRCLRLALGPAHARQLQPQGGVVEHIHVRHQRERLEHHADVLAPQCAQLPAGQAADVGVVHQNAAGRGLDQQVEQAYQRGFARTGQAHDHKDFTRLNGESGVEYADRVAGTLQNLVLAATLADKLQCLLRRIAEDFEHMVDGDFFCHAGGSPSLNGWNTARPPLADRFEALVRP